MSLPIRLLRLPHGRGLPAPDYHTLGAAGADLRAALPESTVLVIEPGARDRVPTGLAIELPEGFEAQVRPRSGLAHRHGVTVLNAPGTVDADFRGELEVLLVNLGQQPFAIRRGDRIAQLVVARVERVRFEEADALGSTARGVGGYGSTGFAEPASPGER